MIVVVTPEEYTGITNLDNEKGLELETIIICDNESEYPLARRIAKAIEVDAKKERKEGNSLIIPIYKEKSVLQ